jgi:1,4-dihydroxy-2-naphthoate octaprenyltransferase
VSPARAWILAARPQTLTAALAPVLVGAAVAWVTGHTRNGAIVAALLGAIWIQIGTNLANDLFDHEKGADGPDRLGPTRVTQAGLLSPGAVRTGMLVAFGLATLAGAYLAAVAGWPVVAIGLVSITSGVAYTGGPWPLGYHGLGDAFVLLFFGPVAVCGTAFVATGGVPFLALLASVPVGCIATAVLVVNNVRDHETDARAGKRTLAVRFGRRFGVGEYTLLLAVAYAVPALLALSGARSSWVLLPFATLPVALSLTRAVASESAGPPLNRALVGTARLLLAFAVLLALGIALG